MKCTNCGADNPETSTFCGNCGAKLPLDWFSPSLGKLTKKQDNKIRIVTFLILVVFIAVYVGFRMANDEPVFSKESLPMAAVFAILLMVVLVLKIIFKRK